MEPSLLNIRPASRMIASRLMRETSSFVCEEFFQWGMHSPSVKCYSSTISIFCGPRHIRWCVAGIQKGRFRLDQLVITDVRGPILVITLNRSEAMNSLDKDIARELEAAFRAS
jgi:hypothetical protein